MLLYYTRRNEANKPELEDHFLRLLFHYIISHVINVLFVDRVVRTWYCHELPENTGERDLGPKCREGKQSEIS